MLSTFSLGTLILIFLADYIPFMQTMSIAERIVDMGIAMSHFKLTLQELGVTGEWQNNDPGIAMPELTEYSVRWAEKL